MQILTLIGPQTIRYAAHKKGRCTEKHSGLISLTVIAAPGCTVRR